MDVAHQSKKVLLFFTEDGFIAIRKEMAICSWRRLKYWAYHVRSFLITALMPLVPLRNSR